MNSLELYTNNKTFYPSLENNTIHISNIVMNQLNEEDFLFFNKNYKQTKNEKIELKINKELYRISNWQVTSFSDNGITILYDYKQLI